uniref:DDE-1 domain-containing protein n=1 Tax=Amphimedon queenslandica TaxID=400682 RepID=A0A1X7U5T8_AMPQE
MTNYLYIKNVCERLGFESPAVVIIDNFKGQVTEDIDSLLEFYNIHTCLLPPNTTSSLQPLDVAVDKHVKDFLKRKFDDWYTSQVMEQIQGISDDDIETHNLQPIDLSMARVKEISAEWLVQVSMYIASNLQFLVNGFINAGITGALDNLPNKLHEALESEIDSDSNSESDEESHDETTGNSH